MRKTMGLLGAAVAVVGAWACSDLREPSSITDVEPLQSHVGSCDLRSVTDAARRYLATPLQQQVSEKLRQIQSGGCTGEANERLAWEVLATVEQAFYARQGGAASDGANLVNGVLHCCIPWGNTFLLDAKVLATGGVFGVRGAVAGAAPAIDNFAPVLSRDAVPVRFGSEDGAQVVRPAIFALRPRPPASWQDVAFGSGVPDTFSDDATLLTGFPAGAVPYASYDFNEAPDLGFEPGRQVDVIVCFTDGADAPGDPHATSGDAFAARMKRNGVLLQTVAGVEQFCQQWVWGPRALATQAAASSPLSSLARWAGRLLLPEPLLAALALDDRTTPAFGGGASFFSHFELSNANTNGSIAFLQGPPALVETTATFFPVSLQAKSGGGSPIEHVEITLYLQNNLGVPGTIVGTFVDCGGAPRAGAVACTDELNGIATFNVSVSKAGGYVLCARGTLDGFTFADVCSERFHVRN